MDASKFDELRTSATFLANEHNQNLSAIHFFMAVVEDSHAVDYLLQHGFEDADDLVKELMMILPEKDNRESAQIDLARSSLSVGYYAAQFLEHHKLNADFYDPIVLMMASLRAIQEMDIDEIYAQTDIINRLEEITSYIEKHYVPSLVSEQQNAHVSHIFSPGAAADRVLNLEQNRNIGQGLAALLRTQVAQPPLEPSSPPAQDAATSRQARSTSIRPVFASTKEQETYRNLDQLLAARVIGQDEAVEALTKAVRRARAGLRAKDKTEGSFIFTGPTGVGKTESAKALAALLERPFVRFDMADFMEGKHAVSKFISAPPGYVGHNPKGGLLHHTIRENPHAILLLDEVEKAHPDIFNVLLQVMDNGKLATSSGEDVDFSNVLLIMTTNAGAAAAARQTAGFGTPEFNASAQDDALKNFFAPEFRNRLDAVVPFHHLSAQVMRQIVDKFLGELNTGPLRTRGICADFSDAAREWLAVKGYDRAFGARPLKRLIEAQFVDPLADRILFGDLQRGGNIWVDVAADQKSLAIAIPPALAATVQ